MLTKLLSSQAIIPDRLYVERAADRQLAQAIASMGKPPYVLVARQMGKTNLLLHAKRRLQTEQDVFCYLDLTKKFPSLAHFFEFVIDRILDSHDGLRAATTAEIARIRNESSPELAAVTYERSLLSVLENIPGRLVVLFDEVDSLATCPFSDRIFSQIRSIYFERGNDSLRALRRLTYVLSGVAEPRDLIKDRSISPFNIGDKIVLDDFSLDEVAEFSIRANLSVPEETIKKVYNHTSGNPRMVWDVFSQLEDMVIQGVNPGEEQVDDVVERLYFNDIPAPPIDHIRTLVTDERDLRMAVGAVHSGEFSKISDLTRSRMYLAGITRSIAGGAAVEWRSSVVRRSLSPEWLATLIDVSADAMLALDQAFATKNFSDVERIYRSHLETEMLPADVKHGLRLKFARSIMEQRRFTDALPIFGSIDDDTSCPYEVRLQAVFFRGVSLESMDRSEEALEDYVRVATSDGDVDQRAHAKYRVASTLSRLKASVAADAVAKGPPAELIKAWQEAIDFVDEKSEALKSSTRADIIGPATLALAEIMSALRSDEGALTLLRRGFVEAHNSLKPRIVPPLLQLLTSEEERSVVIEAVCNLLLTESQRTAGTAAVEGFDRSTIVTIAAHAYSLNLKSHYTALLQYAARSGLASHDGLDVLKLEVWETALESGQENVTLLCEIVDGNESVEGTQVGRALAHIVTTKPAMTKYLSLFLQRVEDGAKSNILSDDDFTAINEVLRSGLAGRRLGAAHRLLRSLEIIVDQKSHHQSIAFWASIYMAARLSWNTNRTGAAELFARSLLEVAPRRILEQGFGVGGAEDILKSVRSIATAGRHQKKREQGKKIGRNTLVRVQYPDGKQIKGKFKRLEADIRQNKCVVID
jgi:hypothetical protein